MPDIVVCGHMCLDLHPNIENVSLEQLPSPGVLFEVGHMAVSTGGAVSNTGLALHQLGVDVRLMANVGDDMIGQLILNVVDRYSPRLKESLTIKQGTQGSYTVVLSPGRSDRIFLHCPGTNTEFGAADVQLDRLDGAKIFHLGYPSILPRLVREDGEELLAIFQRVKAAGLITSMDMSLPDPNGATGSVNWRRIFERVLPYVDIFLPSLDEACFVLRPDDFARWHRGGVIAHTDAVYLDALTDELLSLGTVITGLKLGEHGFYLKTSPDAALYERFHRLPLDILSWVDQQVYQPAFEVNVVGTTGAGDAAYAGFLTAMLKGESARDAARWFCAVGAHNVEAPDATSGIRSWETTGERLAKGWALCRQRVEGFT